MPSTHDDAASIALILAIIALLWNFALTFALINFAAKLLSSLSTSLKKIGAPENLSEP